MIKTCTQSVFFFQPQNNKSYYSNLCSPTKSNAVNDNVRISDEGKFALFSRKMAHEVNNSISIGSINQDFMDATSFVEKRLRLLYQKNGISSNSQMDIAVGGDGKIIVNGKSPEADKLAREINNDEELSNGIRGMSMMASALEAIKRHQEFVAAYENDPSAAIDRYGYLLEDGHNYHASFSVIDGHINTKVQYI